MLRLHSASLSRPFNVNYASQNRNGVVSSLALRVSVENTKIRQIHNDTTYLATIFKKFSKVATKSDIFVNMHTILFKMFTFECRT